MFKNDKPVEQVMAEMDAAAGVAEDELQNIDQDTVDKMATWWLKNYMKAGHKRLGRVLVQWAKDMTKSPPKGKGEESHGTIVLDL